MTSENTASPEVHLLTDWMAGHYWDFGTNKELGTETRPSRCQYVPKMG